MSTDNSTRKSIVYLVGAGPGDPGLITLRGVECLRRADVVIYDYLASAQLLRHAPGHAECIYVGKKAGQHTLKQDEINALIVSKAVSGAVVVRLKGGDPFVFGRGGEECLALDNAGISFEVVPGITSGIAGACCAGIPVTHRNVASSVALVTGHEDPSKAESTINWKGLSIGVDTIIFYMGVSTLASIVQKLVENGKDRSTPVAVVQWGATPRQRTVTGTLETIHDCVVREKISSPAITVVGEVVNLRETLNWFEKRPLFGKKIITTRSRNQASSLSEKLWSLGAEVTELPTIAIEPVDENSELDKIVLGGLSYDWIILTSPNAVSIFFDRVNKHHGDIRAIGSAKIACIGPATAKAVASYFLHAEIIAQDAVAEGLISELKKSGPWNAKRVLFPRAEEAREALPEMLREWGAVVDVITAYRTIKPPESDSLVLDDLLNGRYDLITFSSSSTFKNFAAMIGEENFAKIKPNLKAASIGPVTSDTIRSYGIAPEVHSTEHCIDGLVNAIQEYYTKS